MNSPIKVVKPTIVITAEQAAGIQAIVKRGKTCWVVASFNTLYTFTASRNNARELRAVGELKGQVLKSDEINFIVENDHKPYGFEIHGLTNCPHCGIHLSNGIGEHEQDVNGKSIEHSKFRYECLACGTEFGPEIVKKPKVDKVPSTKSHLVTHESTVDMPCKRVWDIATTMRENNPLCKRKEILAACVEAGIAYYTARTQFQAWLAVQKEMAARVASQGKK